MIRCEVEPICSKRDERVQGPELLNAVVELTRTGQQVTRTRVVEALSGRSGRFWGGVGAS